MLRGELPVDDSIPLEALEELPPVTGAQPRVAIFHEAERAFKWPEGWTVSNLWEPSGGQFIYSAGGDKPAEALVPLPPGQEWLVWLRVRDETDGQRQMMAQVNGVDSYVMGGANSTQWMWYYVGTAAEELLQVVLHSLSPGMEGWTDCLYVSNDPAFVPSPTPASPPGFRTLADWDRSAQQPGWLWWPAEPAPDSMACFRKEFDLDAAPQAAVLAAQGHEAYAASINGVEVANRLDAGTPESLDVAQYLVKGRNTLCFTLVQQLRLPGVRALLSGTMPDGSRWRVTTDSSWQASDEPAEGWQQAGFDGAAWQRPWCRLGDREVNLAEP